MIQDMPRVFHSMQENFMEEKFATTLARRLGASVRIIAEIAPGKPGFRAISTTQRPTATLGAGASAQALLT
jgi:hypothetical protein